MKKERQAVIRAAFPERFALELEDAYRRASGAHRALSFTGFLGFLAGLGLEAYRESCGREAAPESREEYEGRGYNFTPKYLQREFK
jgi:hypothetical protein